MIELRCQYCGLVRNYAAISYFHFHENHCSKNPNRKIRKGHKHTEEQKKHLSEIRKKFLQEHPDAHPWKKSSKFKSKPCEELKQWLKDNNIDFEEEVSVVPGKNYSADIVFPKAMLIVEVNGNQHYDLSKMELLPYYQKRHDEIEALGWEVLEVPYNQSYSEEFRIGLCRQLEAKLSSKQLIYVGSSPISPIPYLKTLAQLKKDRVIKKQQQMLEKAERIRTEKERKRIERIEDKKIKDAELKKLKQKEKEEKICLFEKQGFKIDSLGRVLTCVPTKNDWIKRKELILNCGVDITKFGWVGKVEKATGLSKRIIENTVKYFDLKVFKRKPPHST